MFATESKRKSVNENENVAVGFLDLSKFFDLISHKIHQKKLKTLNFDENAKTMMKTYLTERHQKVALSTCDWDWIQLHQAVLKCIILGPLLFNIYVNGIQRTVAEICSLIQYTVDAMIN